MTITRTFVLDDDTAQRLEEMAAKTERTKSAMLRWLINGEWHRWFDPARTTPPHSQTEQAPVEQPSLPST